MAAAEDAPPGRDNPPALNPAPGGPDLPLAPAATGAAGERRAAVGRISTDGEELLKQRRRPSPPVTRSKAAGGAAGTQLRN